AAKRRVLEHVLSGPPQHVRFVPCDFNQDSVEVAMAHVGYSEAARTFILWEGVTNYLTEAAVDAPCAGARRRLRAACCSAPTSTEMCSLGRRHLSAPSNSSPRLRRPARS